MKKFYLLCALCVFSLAACNNEDGNGAAHKGKLTLTSSSVMEFGADGGAGEIAYTFVTEADKQSRSAGAAKPTPICVVDWITDLAATADNTITFNVTPNSGEERSASIKVEYGDDNFQVMIIQQGDHVVDVDFTATYLGGSYYGKFIDGETQTEGFNYFIILSDEQPGHYSYVNPYATEYRFDLYAAECAEFDNELRIPVGTYTLDHARTGRVGTIDGYKDCSYCYVDGNLVPYGATTLTVTEDGIVADITFMDGTTRRVVYNGAPVVGDYVDPTFADVVPWSSYTEPISFDVTNGYMYAYYRGDWFNTGNDVWFMHMIENKDGFNGVYMLFNLIVPKSGGIDNMDSLYGTYSLSDVTKSLDYTFPAGRMRDDGTTLNAWYSYCMMGGAQALELSAPIKGGTIKIEKGDANQTIITVDGVDDVGNTIKGTFRGTIYEWGDQGVVNK